jgi:hypothetical protein
VAQGIENFLRILDLAKKHMRDIGEQMYHTTV